jgi:hypothetical protein
MSRPSFMEETYQLIVLTINRSRIRYRLSWPFQPAGSKEYLPQQLPS